MRKVIALLFIFYISVYADPGDRRVYNVDNFAGGLNLLDSLNLKPNEALQLDNFVLDRFASLHKRYGATFWNDSLISTGHIKDICYVENKNGSDNLYIASGNYIYQLPGWTDTVASWSGKIVDYTRGQIDTCISGQKYIYGDTTYWIIAAAPNDRITIGDSTYVIDSILADTCLHVTTTTAMHPTSNYKLKKYINSDVQLSSWNGNLYVADSKGEAWFYNDSTLQLLGIADYGTASTVTATDSTMSSYSDTFLFQIGHGEHFLETQGVVSTDSFSVGDILHLTVKIGFLHNSPVYRFTSEIAGKGGNHLYFADNITGENFNPHLSESYLVGPISWPSVIGYAQYSWYSIEVDAAYSLENAFYMTDTLKNWRADEWLEFMLIAGNDADAFDIINTNTANAMYFDSSVTMTVGDRYYIAWQVPSMRKIRVLKSHNRWGFPIYGDSMVINQKRFKNMTFHRNRLFAIGDEINGISYEDYNENDTINTVRVWYADLGIPTYIPSDYNFDLTGANRGERSLYSSDQGWATFELRDDLYFVTASNIYRMSGEIDPNLLDLGIYLSQVIRGIGTNQSRGVITTKDNVAYIMNQEGIWRFDGRIIEKISYKIEPLIEKYRKSRMVAGQFKDNLYFSYPDSNVTIVLHEPTAAFSLWTVGMEYMNNQFVAIDSNYFLFSTNEDSAYVLQYPAGIYYDIISPGDTTVFSARYRSGWTDLGDMSFRKIIEDMDIIAYNAGVSSWTNDLRIRGDFADTVLWEDSAFAGGGRVHHLQPGFGNDNGRDVWQVNVVDSTKADFYLTRYRIKSWDTSR